MFDCYFFKFYFLCKIYYIGVRLYKLQKKDMNPFIHLHTHSYYSFLNGIASPEELVVAAKKAAMPALALTDYNGLYGAVAFYQKAKAYGIKPLIGAELTFEEKFNLVFLVKNETGYHHLSQMITLGRLNGGHNRFRLSLTEIRNLSAGLIVLSGGMRGKIPFLLTERKVDEALKEVRFFKELFGEDFYIELQHFSSDDTLSNIRLRDISMEQHIPLVASNNVHFLHSQDWPLRRVMRAIAANTVLDKVTDAGSPEQFLKTSRQMASLFHTFPAAIANTRKIAELCNFEFQLGRPVFPSIALPKGESSFSYLWKKSFAGAGKRYRPLTSQVIKRLEYELQIIHDLGFAEYFLIVKNIVDYCRRQHIPCVGRGSAADSLVSYVLEITQADPIRHRLYFERFLNPERSDPPDIDLDICRKNRDRVLHYVYDTFDKERTAMICTFHTFQNRSAIRDVAKAFGLPEEEIAKFTKYLPRYARGEIEEAFNHLPELSELKSDLSTFREIMRIARRIADFPRHLSIHPGGIIIAPRPITFYTPLERAGKDLVISQYDMHSIEKLGLVKIDLLGVRSLTIITETLKVLHKRLSAKASAVAKQIVRKTSAEFSALSLGTIPENDPQVTAFIRSGKTIGCFQLESPAMRGLLKKMQIENVDDVITAVALIRPGASGSGMKEVYIRRRAGLEKVSYVHPALAPVLNDTYGVIIYQEQVLRVAHQIAKLSLGQADLLRRAMTKSRNQKDFLRLHDSFFRGALQNGLNQTQAEAIWSFLSHFVGYGFNKAHSATYGTIAYQTAFLKYYFPVEYMCAVLNNPGGFYSRMAYAEEARRMGIQLLPPDIYRSEKKFSCESGAIRTGLSAIYELSARAVQTILSERKLGSFPDLFNFIQRTRIGEKETEHLIKAGALSEIHPSQPQLLLLNKLFFKNSKKSSIARFLSKEIHLAPFNRYQKIINEMEILDFAVTGHPLTLFEEQIRKLPIISSEELESHQNKTILFCGWLVTTRRVDTANNQFMKFLTLEDRRGMCEAVLFPKAYKKYGHLIRSHGPFLLSGRIQSRLPGEANLIITHLKVLEPKKRDLEEALQSVFPKAPLNIKEK